MAPLQSSLDVHMSTYVGYLRGNEQGELPVDDPPPADHPSERYSAWAPTAIFELQPFSSPYSR